MKKNQVIFNRYIQIAELLGQMFPKMLEVVIHDFENLDQAIISIVNGHISGRSIGGPVSELNLRRLLEEGQFPDQIVNFSSISQRGQPLKSSSLAIRDDKGKLIGAFCIHFDLSHFEQFHKFLDFFLKAHVDPLVGVNDFGSGAGHDTEISEAIDAWLLNHGVHASQLTYADKQSVVGHLFTLGYFKRKGAVTTVASALKLTRQSVYNYLEQARNSHG